MIIENIVNLKIPSHCNQYKLPFKSKQQKKKNKKTSLNLLRSFALTNRTPPLQRLQTPSTNWRNEFNQT